jgi:peptide/nickel transport system substrate-binding protein
MKRVLLYFTPLVMIAATTTTSVVYADDPWSIVRDILSSTRDIIVFDGVDQADNRSAETQTPLVGDWLVRHSLSDPTSMNPYTASDAAVSEIHAYVFEALLNQSPEPPFQSRGHIALDYPTISEDKLRYAFRLRDGVVFSDGVPLTSADVIFSLKVILHPEVLAASLRNYYGSVVAAERDGEYGVVISCKEPYFRNDLMLGGFKVIPRHFYDPDDLLGGIEVSDLVDGSWMEGPQAEGVHQFAERFNQDFSRRVLGSGPYQLLDPEADMVTQQKVVLTRDEDYWGRDIDSFPQSGYVEKIVFKIINNTDAAFIELTNGDVDYLDLSSLEFKQKSWDPDFQRSFMKAIRYRGGYTFIGWNNARPLFADKRVRQALTLLTDRQGMIENLLFGLGEPVVGPIHKFRPEYNQSLELFPYDPDRALDLLYDAGWDDADEDGTLDKLIDGELVPFRFEIMINSGNQLRKDIALVVQSELADIGIDCQVRELDWSIFLQRADTQDFDAIVLGWTGNVRFPPDAYQIWHSSQAEGQGSNFVTFLNEEVDSILEEYRKEFDSDRRVALYQRFQEILHEEQPYTFLWKQRLATSYSRRFRGVNWYPGADRGSIGEITMEWWVQPPERAY